MALRTFRSLTFRKLGTFASGTWTGQGAVHPSPRSGLQTFSCRTFALVRTFACDTFGGFPLTVPHQGCVPLYTPTVVLFGLEERVWDNIESLIYTSVSKNGDTIYCPANCHRSAVTAKELAVSDGVYVPRDIVMRIPRTQLPVLPKPRDRWTDGEANTFTVLELGRNRAKNCFRLVCRNLVIEHQLDDLITVQRASISYDTAGVIVRSWFTLYSGLHARIQPNTAEITDERGIRGLKITHECIVEQLIEDVTNQDRVVLNGVYYEVRGFSYPERIDELMRLELERVP